MNLRNFVSIDQIGFPYTPRTLRAHSHMYGLVRVGRVSKTCCPVDFKSIIFKIIQKCPGRVLLHPGEKKISFQQFLPGLRTGFYYDTQVSGHT